MDETDRRPVVVLHGVQLLLHHVTDARDAVQCAGVDDGEVVGPPREIRPQLGNKPVPVMDAARLEERT